MMQKKLKKMMIKKVQFLLEENDVYFRREIKKVRFLFS